MAFYIRWLAVTSRVPFLLKKDKVKLRLAPIYSKRLPSCPRHSRIKKVLVSLMKKNAKQRMPCFTWIINKKDRGGHFAVKLKLIWMFYFQKNGCKRGKEFTCFWIIGCFIRKLDFCQVLEDLCYAAL